jgi:hypothetical protein
MRKLFTILSAVAITVGVGVPAGAAMRSSGRMSGSGHPGHGGARHGDMGHARHSDMDRGRDRDRDRNVRDRDRDFRDRDRDFRDRDRDRDRNFRDRDRDRDRNFRDRDRDRDRRDFDRHRHRRFFYPYYPYYPYYGDSYYDDYGDYGYGDCDYGPPPDGVVVIRCIAFNPPRIHVGVGQDVVWSWQDGRTPHTVTADDGSFDSGRRTGGELRVTFNHPGEFTYHCRVHPRMAGSVIVG